MQRRKGSDWLLLRWRGEKSGSLCKGGRVSLKALRLLDAIKQTACHVATRLGHCCLGPRYCAPRNTAAETDGSKKHI